MSWWNPFRSSDSSIRSRSGSASMATSSSRVGHAEEFTIEDRLRRVTRDDLSAVTAEDVQRLKARLTPEELKTAMLVLLETNRFSDVLACSSSPAWTAAARGVTPVQMGMIGALVRERACLLYSVLPFVTEDFLDVMRAAFVSEGMSH